MQEIFIEAESFSNLGGWCIEQQSFETLGSAYLMAHGMGRPVVDASTDFLVEQDNEYNVYAFTRDWTASFGCKGTPAGRFSVAIDGLSFSQELGTNGKDWSWQKAGKVFLKKGWHTLCLHDLTGFNARVDALYFVAGDQQPEAIEVLRERLWQKDEIRQDETQYDLIVVGGGVAGVCMALTAIRSGVKTLLIQDREVLGGCNSSEIRVCMGGQVNMPPYPNLGNVVKEIQPICGDPSFFKVEYFEDLRKKHAFEIPEHPQNYKIAYNERVVASQTEDGEIKAVTTVHTRTGKKTVYKANLFADCSGDATLARLSGAKTMYGRESEETFGESLAPKVAEKLVMGHSIRWYAEKETKKSDFPLIDWALPFTEETCYHVRNGDWEQEAGFARDMVKETEQIRDYGLLAIYSNWSFQKNISKRKEEYAYDKLQWVSPLGGKRESYRVVGDLVLTQQDIEEKRIYKDATACMTWSIDMHFPEPDNARIFGEPFRSFAYHRGIEEPYPVPYRCLYARDVSNLFLGGRIVSMSHVAFSAVRVMRTLGMLGEVVGLAASVCKEKRCNPRDVYELYWEDMHQKLEVGAPIIHSFECTVGREEAYHFKDIGWIFFDRNRCDSEDEMEKFIRNIQELGLKHKYPYPKNVLDFLENAQKSVETKNNDCMIEKDE